MHFHGLNDLIVPYNGTAYQQPSPDSFAYWGQADGCSGQPEVTYTKGNSQCEVYKSCGAATEAGLCSLAGGHILYTNMDDVPIADLAWDFLERFTLP
jgi:poly(3-hydroxybutyrate) depolymerase